MYGLEVTGVYTIEVGSMESMVLTKKASFMTGFFVFYHALDNQKIFNISMVTVPQLAD